MRTDPRYAINCRMHGLINKSLKGKNKKAGERWELAVGYPLDALMAHLERQFLPKMTWTNRSLWQIDHIVPVTAFVFQSIYDADFKACWAMTNLRPLWKADNMAKSNKLLFLL